MKKAERFNKKLSKMFKGMTFREIAFELVTMPCEQIKILKGMTMPLYRWVKERRIEWIESA